MSREHIISLGKKDFVVQTFYAGGPGGQNQNKRKTGVRIIHRESGASAESREHRKQVQNKSAAFQKLATSEKFRLWVLRLTAPEESIFRTEARIRTYDHKNRVVIDHRTGRRYDIVDVLNGELDPIMDDIYRLHIKEESAELQEGV